MAFCNTCIVYLYNTIIQVNTYLDSMANELYIFYISYSAIHQSVLGNHIESH